MLYNSGKIKMKKYFVIIISTVILFAFGGCQEFVGDPITKDFSISGIYTALDVDDAFDITVSDLATQVTITAGENVMPNVVVETVDNTLKIYIKGWHTSYGTDMKVTLPYNANLKSVDLSGASSFQSVYGLKGSKVKVDLSGSSDFDGNIDADEVVIDLSGSSNFNGNILADKIDMELSGSSDINGLVDATNLEIDLGGASDATLEGEVGTLIVELSGASNIVKKVVGDRYALVCDLCEGSISGASNAYIHCDGTIKVSLSGASKLHFTGSAFTGDSSTSGSSHIYHDVL